MYPDPGTPEFSRQEVNEAWAEPRRGGDVFRDALVVSPSPGTSPFGGAGGKLRRSLGTVYSK